MASSSLPQQLWKKLCVFRNNITPLQLASPVPFQRRAFTRRGGKWLTIDEELRDDFEKWSIKHGKSYNTPQEKESGFQSYKNNDNDCKNKVEAIFTTWSIIHDKDIDSLDNKEVYETRFQEFKEKTLPFVKARDCMMGTGGLMGTYRRPDAYRSMEPRTKPSGS